MLKIDAKRFGTFLLVVLLAAFGAYHFVIHKQPVEAKNPYVSQASIVKIPDVIHEAVQVEHGAIVDKYAGTIETLVSWKINATYDNTNTALTKIIVSNSTTYTYEILVSKSNEVTVSYITVGPNGNKVTVATTSKYVLPLDLLGQYPYNPHVIGLVKNTPVVIIFNPNQTTAVFEKLGTIPYFYINSYTTTISGVKHVLVTSVNGTYIISSANYTTEILR